MKIKNKLARHIAISSSGIQAKPTGGCDKRELLKLIKYLGYVQQDPIQVVARAHDHILWTRNGNYRNEQLDALLEVDRSVFEHFCHDACVLPMDTLPFWQGQFQRKASLSKSNGARTNLLGKVDQKKLINKISTDGPLCSRDFKIGTKKNGSTIWSKPKHKQTLDHLWLTGKLAVSKREKFIKYYDLADRVYPKKLVQMKKSHDERIDWLAKHALERLGFATHSEIKRFWDAFTLDESKTWCDVNSSNLTEVSIESCNGEHKKALVLKKSVSKIRSPLPLSKRMKIINPFDPLTRDRNRLERLFGFEYRIEMYVPKEKRKYGYYVYPLLEYDYFVGRLEVRHDRKRNILCVDNLWPEPGIKFGKQRMGKLKSELERMKRFCSADSVEWSS